LDDIAVDVREESLNTTLDLITEDPLISKDLFATINKNLNPVISSNNFMIDKVQTPERTDSEGKLTYELSLEDKEFFEDTKKLGQKLLQEIEYYE
jgi:hypothetical protein